MDDTQKKSKFGIGLLLGSVAGAIAAIFLTPKTGKESRELALQKLNEFETYLKVNEVDVKVKKIFDDVSEDAKAVYKEVVADFSKALTELQEKVGEIDKDAYLDKMEEVIGNSRLQKVFPMEVVENFRKFLSSSYEKLTQKKDHS